MKSLLEVVQTGAKNIEISVMESYGKVTVSLFLTQQGELDANAGQNLDLAEIEAIVSEIEREKEAGLCMTRRPRLTIQLIFSPFLFVLQRLKENAHGWPQPQQDRLLWLKGQENNQLWIVMYKICYNRGRIRMPLFYC